MNIDLATSLLLLPHSSLELESKRRKNTFHLPRPSFVDDIDQVENQHQQQNHSTPPFLDTTLSYPPSPSPPSSPQPSLPQPPKQLPLAENLFHYSPFPRCSVNLITCSSNSGKTHFLNQVIRHRDIFFESPGSIHRIVYVNGNQRDFSAQHPWSANTNNNEDDGANDKSSNTIDLDVLSLSIDEFSDFTTVLQTRDILILDDILKLNDDIQFIIKYGAHHYSLSAVFIVTQSCLSSPLYALIGSVHNIVLLFGNTATTRLAQHLVQSFFLCPDTKAYLKRIFGAAEKHQDVVILKLNAVASNRSHASILALTQVQKLFPTPPDVPYCFVFPELGHLETLLNKMPSSIEAEMPSVLLEGNNLQEAFVLLPASRVRQQANDGGGSDGTSGSGKLCANEKEKKWNEMALFLENEIESTFPFKKWNSAKNLTRELLRCKQLCISSDYRTVFVSDKPKLAFSIIDFLNAAIRKAGPGETVEKVDMYRPLVQILLRHNVPHAFIINKLMLPEAAAKASRGIGGRGGRMFAAAGSRHRKGYNASKQTFSRHRSRHNDYSDLYM